MQYNVALPHLGDRDAGNVHRVVDNGRRETFEQADIRGFDMQVQDVERRGVDGLQNAPVEGPAAIAWRADIRIG